MVSESVYASLRYSSQFLAKLTAAEKNTALESVILSIDSERKKILSANKKDIRRAQKDGMSESLIDRLLLTNERISAIISSLKAVIAQPDPVGQILAGWKTAYGLEIRQVRVPFGLIAIIYESRPNVTIDAFALAWKSGNAVLLRGSSSAVESNRALTGAIKLGLSIAETAVSGIVKTENLYTNAIFLADGGREEVDEILSAKGKIDVLLPRGGAELIRMVSEKARVPIIETGSGVCHLFVDESAALNQATAIAKNGKLQRPGVCNAIETLLVHKNCAMEFLPLLAETFEGRAELRCCKKSFAIVQKAVMQSANEKVKSTKIIPASEDDFGVEFLDYILAVKIIDSLEEAIQHINTHNTKHSEAILTQNRENARRFQQSVDAACVYVNASTRFTDGGEFGFGAELGISTQKLHVRGPMGLTALTTSKYYIDGEGHIR